MEKVDYSPYLCKDCGELHPYLTESCPNTCEENPPEENSDEEVDYPPDDVYFEHLESIETDSETNSETGSEDYDHGYDEDEFDEDEFDEGEFDEDEFDGAEATMDAVDQARAIPEEENDVYLEENDKTFKRKKSLQLLKEAKRQRKADGEKNNDDDGSSDASSDESDLCDLFSNQCSTDSEDEQD